MQEALAKEEKSGQARQLAYQEANKSLQSIAGANSICVMPN
jgi:hypothetical protein